MIDLPLVHLIPYSTSCDVADRRMNQWGGRRPLAGYHAML